MISFLAYLIFKVGMHGTYLLKPEIELKPVFSPSKQLTAPPVEAFFGPFFTSTFTFDLSPFFPSHFAPYFASFVSSNFASFLTPFLASNVTSF
jgi:hypothetical protein